MNRLLAACPTAAARFCGGGAPIAGQKVAARDAVVPVTGVREALRRGYGTGGYCRGAWAC